MNRESVNRTLVDVERIRIHHPVAERFAAMAKLHKDEPRFGSQAMDGGSRSTDSTSSVERAVMSPDVIQRRLLEFSLELRTAAAALERASVLVRWLEASGEPVERTNSVTVCVVCEAPCVPKVLNHVGYGPFDSACYQSWRRFKDANPSGTFGAWVKSRSEVAA